MSCLWIAPDDGTFGRVNCGSPRRGRLPEDFQFTPVFVEEPMRPRRLKPIAYNCAALGALYIVSGHLSPQSGVDFQIVDYLVMEEFLEVFLVEATAL